MLLLGHSFLNFKHFNLLNYLLDWIFMSQHIHWFPGHIAKAQKQLKEKLSLVDVVIEVIDARIPYSSWYKTTEALCQNKPRFILMNKSDVSDPELNKIWAQKISSMSNCEVLITNLNRKNDTNLIIEKALKISKELNEKRKEKGLLPRAIRTMVIGMPNVGKSTIINRLVKRAKTKTGAKAGVTRQQQWVRINDKIELLDTPGIIPSTQDDQYQALKLACVNSIGENAYNSEYVASNLIKILNNYYHKELCAYYDFEDDEEINLETIAFKRNWILKGSKPDYNRTSNYILSTFRDGKIGKFTLEKPNEYEKPSK